jgi:hypothetical protein
MMGSDMADDQKTRTAGGSVVHRYEAREREWQAPAHEDGSMEEIERHLARFGVASRTVLHEVVSDLVHLDVHVCSPSADRNFYTLFTTGMSDLPMTTPEGLPHLRHAELMLCLPPGWPLQGEGGAVDPRPESYWPIRLLKFLARFPHEYQSWLGSGHTIPNGDPPEAYAPGTELCCAMLAAPRTLPPDAQQVRIREDKVVNLYAVIPLHKAEVDLKLAKGSDALYDLFDRKKVSEVLDPGRPPVTRKRLFGIF